MSKKSDPFGGFGGDPFEPGKNKVSRRGSRRRGKSRFWVLWNRKFAKTELWPDLSAWGIEEDEENKTSLIRRLIGRFKRE